MSASFDWEIVEESDTSRFIKGSLPRSRKRRRWRRRAVALAVLVLTGLLIRACVLQRLKVAEWYESELRAAVAVELKAIAAGDVELFRNLQDPSDLDWQDRQVGRYLSPNAEHFVPAPGLTPADRPPEIERIHYFGHGGRAELIRWYEAANEPNHRATGSVNTWGVPLPFAMTWYYRHDENGNWFHVAPPSGCWGVPFSWRGTRLKIHATEAEAKSIEPIARDLAILVTDACQLVGCPENLEYTLSFEDILAPSAGGELWTLPALYLTGQPVNKGAFGAWRRALTLWVVEALVQAQLDQKGLADRVGYRDLVARLQGELGLLDLTAPNPELYTGSLTRGTTHSLPSMRQAEETSSYRLSPNDLEGAWVAYLSELTGVSVPPEPTRSVCSQLINQVQEPPPALVAPSTLPGDQIALVCDNQIWVGNLDGGDLVPLTNADQRFGSIRWAPDGRWLLATWYHSRTCRQGAIYLLSADGSEGRRLTHDARLDERAIDWSPDGRRVYYSTFEFSEGSSGTDLEEIWAMDVETGETQRLPGVPTWSPDGEHLVYSTISSSDLSSTVWLAETSDSAIPAAGSRGKPLEQWSNTHQIADNVRGTLRKSWSPDGSKLAFILDDNQPDQRAVAIYDLATEKMAVLVTLFDLRATAIPWDSHLLPNGSNLSAVADASLVDLRLEGWSADGIHLLVTAVAHKSEPFPEGPTALMMISLDGAPPRVLAYAEYGTVFAVTWSPTNADHLAVAWRNGPQDNPNGYLLDLNSGSIYTATESWNATWSPDGAFVGFAGPNQVTLVDQKGKPRTILRHRNFCSVPVWNPAANAKLPDAECGAGLDAWITQRDVYRVGDDFLLRVHNGGDRKVKNLPAQIVDAAGHRSGMMGLGSLPPCGHLLVRIAARDWTSPLIVVLNPPAEPSTLSEENHGNNQVFVAMD